MLPILGLCRISQHAHKKGVLDISTQIGFWGVFSFFPHCASFFLSLSTPPLARQFPCSKPPLCGTSEVLVLVEKRKPAGTGFWGGVWTGSPHRKKRKFQGEFFFCWIFLPVSGKCCYFIGTVWPLFFVLVAVSLLSLAFSFFFSVYHRNSWITFHSDRIRFFICHLLPHLFLETSFVLITSDNSGGVDI